MVIRSLNLLAILLGLAAAAAASTDEADHRLAEEVGRLASPYAAVRLDAYARLLAAGDEIDAYLARRYPEADFRTKVLLLDLLGERRSIAGLEPVWADLETPSTSVREAQDLYLALLGDEVRDRLLAAVETAEPGVRKRARAALAMLVRMQVERVLLAKAREPALMYRDQYRVLRRDRALATDALLAIIGDGDRGYRFASKVTARADMYEIRELAMDAIADVASPDDARRLRAIHDEMMVRRSDRLANAEEEKEKYAANHEQGDWAAALRNEARIGALEREAELVTRHLEHLQSALYRLGDSGPIDTRIAELEAALERYRYDPETRFELAMAYTRRESYRQAEAIYRDLADGLSSYYRGISAYNLACVLSLQERTEEALEALYGALEREWEQAREHALEDGDLEAVRKAYPNLRELLDAKWNEVERERERTAWRFGR